MLRALKHQNRNSQKILSKYKKLCCRLRQENSKLLNEISENKKEVYDIFQKSKDLNKTFLSSQLRLGQFKRKGRRYLENDKTFALALYYCSPKAYRFLRKNFCLPTIRSLRRWLQGMQVSPGLNDNVLAMLKLKSQLLSTSDRIVSIVFDEMSLKELVAYDARADQFHGFVELGDVEEKLDHKTATAFTNQALVVMMRGIKKNFKQVLGYYFTKDAASAEALKKILINVIKKITEAGFIPKVVVCDQAVGNVKLRKLLGVTDENPVLEVDNNFVYFLYDAPHLLKSVRNNFKKYNFKSGDVEYSWKYIEEFYEKDVHMSLRLAPKLTKRHIDLPPFTSMRVCLAAQVLSHSVATGILTHVALGSMPTVATHTSTFIENMDKLFNCFNSSQIFGQTNSFKKPMSSSSQHWKFLDEMKLLLEGITIMNRTKKTPPCIKGWISNITALKLLCLNLEDNYGFKYILTRRLTQDCIENLFSVLRGKGGCNVTPDAFAFKSCIRLTMANQILSPSEDSNCEMDLDSFLLKRQELQKSSLVFHTEEFNDTSDLDTEQESILINDDELMAEKNAISYVAGWVCSKLPHPECREKISSYDDSYESSQIHTLLKKYEQSSKLLYPTSFATQFISNLLKAKDNYLSRFINESRSNVKMRLILVAEEPEECVICNDCKKIFANKAFNVIINAYIKSVNNDLKNSIRGKKNRKAEKVLHL
jgi:DNA transposase THAP9